MSYWNNEGKYQKEYEELSKLIPDNGPAESVLVDLIRNISNCYYDHYNNGDCKWDHKKEQFQNIRYHAEKLRATAKDENEDIDYLLNFIRQTLDELWDKNNQMEDWDSAYYELPADIEKELEVCYEALSNIIIRWAHLTLKGA